jgi:glycosyltransferase involved in cell wall biosynthesis
MNSASDLISVIVTNYNHAKYLDQRMESLLNQTYPNLEIIVVDNCSTDNSLEVLAKYKKYGHVKIMALEENGGNIHSSNLGVSLSHGQFFIFAEADDYNEPSQIELLHQAMAGNEQIGAAFCRSFMVDAQGKVFDDDFNQRDRSFKEFCSKDTVIPGRLAQRFFLFSCIIPNFSAVLFRRKYFDLAGGLTPLYKACADWDFWFRISRHCDLYYLKTPLNYFRYHAASTGRLLGIQLTVIQIMEMLYKASAQVDLTFWERIQFKVNIGVIWGRFRKPAPDIWWKSFPSIWRESLKYDKLSVVYLVLAFLKRGTERMVGRV